MESTRRKMEDNRKSNAIQNLERRDAGVFERRRSKQQ
jgi:hypothetical protein